MPLARVAHISKSSHKEELIDPTASLGPESCSIRHCDCPPMGGTEVKPYSVTWLLAEYVKVTEGTSNRKVQEVQMNLVADCVTLVNYISECHVIQPFRPPIKV